MKMDKKKIILITFLLIFYFLTGLAAILLSSLKLEPSRLFICSFILAGFVPHFAGFISAKKQTFAKVIFAVLFVSGLIIGFLCLFDKNIDVSTICLIFGILDICRGFAEILIEFYKNFPVINKPLSLLEIAVSTGDIIFGILLIINRINGIYPHLIYLGSAFIVMVIIWILELFKHE